MSSDQKGLMLYNTLQKRMEPFSISKKKQLSFFTCGPSVYRQPHLGNYRTFVFQDVLQRYLEACGWKVKRAFSITDVEDKAIQEASVTGIPLLDLTKQHALSFFREAAQLGLRSSDSQPFASAAISESQTIIEDLLRKKTAYNHAGNIFFKPLSHKSFGKLFGLDLSKWPKKTFRFKKDTYEGNRWNLGDFILWHGKQPQDKIYWESNFGPGRPSWNIQDPAIMLKNVGTTVDIVAGGVDNLYRHHDYNRAVMESFSGMQLSPFWIHNEHLMINNQKMSKSKGRVVFVRDLIDEGCDPQAIRFFLTSIHYQHKLNYTRPIFQAAVKRHAAIQKMVHHITHATVVATEPSHELPNLIRLWENEWHYHMNNNLDVSEAIACCERFLKQIVAHVTSTTSSEALQLFQKTFDKINSVHVWL